MHKRYHEDNLLLDRAKNGDENAFTELFHQYYETMLRYMTKFVKNQIDAEDLAMITFEKVFSNLDKYVPTFGFGTWLSKVGKNTALDFLKQKKIRPNNFVDVFDISLNMSHTNTPEEVYMNKELCSTINDAIGKLRDNYQNVIRWRYYEDLNFREINVKYGIKEKIATSHVFRARRQLKELIQ